MSSLWIKIFLSIAVFFLLIAGFLHPITAYTQDLGRHVLLGKIIFQTHHVPSTNLLSYTFPDFPFLNHHYLSEVIYYLIKQLFGDNGLLFFSVGLVFTAFGLVFYEALKKTSIIPITLVSILSLRILFERTDIRPEQFGYVFLSLFVVILYRFREKQNSKQHVIARRNDEAISLSTKPRIPLGLPRDFISIKSLAMTPVYFLPLLSFFWIQLHISFAIGLGVLFLFLLDTTFHSFKTNSWIKTKRLALVFILCILVSIINPNGLAGFLYPLHIFDNYGYTIQENQTIFLLDQIAPTTSIFYFKIAVLVLFTSLFLSFKKTRSIDWLLAIAFTFLAASAIRNFPLFVFATFLPFSHSLGILYDKLVSKIKNIQFFLLIVVSCLSIGIFWQISLVTKTKPLGIGIAPGAEKAVDFFEKKKLSGPIFNNFDIGSYVAYRLYPKEKVFIDGRPEAYPVTFLQKTYIPMQQDPKLFEQISHKYHFNTIFFSHTDQTPWAEQFLKDIVQNKEWQPVYLDDMVIILTKDTFTKPIDLATFSLPDTSVSNLKSLTYFAHFFNVTGLQEREIATYLAMIHLQPDYCQALRNVTILYAQKNNPAAQMYNLQYGLHCQ